MSRSTAARAGTKSTEAHNCCTSHTTVVRHENGAAAGLLTVHTAVKSVISKSINGEPNNLCDAGQAAYASIKPRHTVREGKG